MSALLPLTLVHAPRPCTLTLTQMVNLAPMMTLLDPDKSPNHDQEPYMASGSCYKCSLTRRTVWASRMHRRSPLLVGQLMTGGALDLCR